MKPSDCRWLKVGSAGSPEGPNPMNRHTDTFPLLPQIRSNDRQRTLNMLTKVTFSYTKNNDWPLKKWWIGLAGVWPKAEEVRVLVARCVMGEPEMRNKKNQEIKKTETIAETRRPCIYWWFMPSKYIKKYSSLYTINRIGGEWSKSAEG